MPLPSTRMQRSRFPPPSRANPIRNLSEPRTGESGLVKWSRRLSRVFDWSEEGQLLDLMAALRASLSKTLETAPSIATRRREPMPRATPSGHG